MEIRTKINIVNSRGESYMGPGVVRLLEGILEHRSISRAARAMNLSYVKALRLLNKLEYELGCKVLIRTRGGCNRGGADITAFGKDYIVEYRRMEHRIGEHGEEEFRVFCQRMERKKDE